MDAAEPRIPMIVSLRLLNEFRDAEGLRDDRPSCLPETGHLKSRHEQDLHVGAKVEHTSRELSTVHQWHDHVHEQEINVTWSVPGQPDRFDRIVGEEDEIFRGQ
jgi:hypothetical protein